MLNPSLFIVYINALVNCSELNYLLYADDAAHTLDHTYLKSLERLHQQYLANELTLNLSKIYQLKKLICAFEKEKKERKITLMK